MAILRLKEVIEKIESGELTRPRHIGDVLHPADLKLLSGNSVLEKCEALLLTYKPANSLYVQADLDELRGRLETVIAKYRDVVNKALNIKDLWYPRDFIKNEAHRGECVALEAMHEAFTTVLQDEWVIKNAGEVYTRQQIEKLQNEVFKETGAGLVMQAFNKLLGNNAA